jgi:multiple sugar transport system permease protein
MRKRAAYTLLAPACAFLLILTVVPAVGVVILSFFEWSGFGRPSFVGLGNFYRLSADDSFFNAAKVTVIFVVSTTLVELVMGIAVAFSMELWPRFRNTIRLLLGFPLVLSPVMSGIIWKLSLNEQTGLFSRVLNLFLSESARPLSSAFGAICTIVAIDIWQWTPLVILLVSLALERFKSRLGDLTTIDALSSRVSLRFVWGPLILPTIGVAALLRTIDSLKVFDIVQSATAGGPGGSSEVLSFYAYKQLIKFGNFGYAASIALLLLLVASVLWLFASKVFFAPWEERL